MDDWTLPYVAALDALTPLIPGSAAWIDSLLAAGEHPLAVMTVVEMADEQRVPLTSEALRALEVLSEEDPTPTTRAARDLALELVAA